eukprot:g3822.t1
MIMSSVLALQFSNFLLLSNIYSEKEVTVVGYDVQDYRLDVNLSELCSSTATLTSSSPSIDNKSDALPDDIISILKLYPILHIHINTTEPNNSCVTVNFTHVPKQFKEIFDVLTRALQLTATEEMENESEVDFDTIGDDIDANDDDYDDEDDDDLFSDYTTSRRSPKLSGQNIANAVIQRAQDIFNDIIMEAKQDYYEAKQQAQAREVWSEHTSKINLTRNNNIKSSVVLGRRCIFFHHIIANSKRKAVLEHASQLEIGGFSKIGWPGIVIVEGAEENIKLYVRALQRLRWKLMVVRGEYQNTIALSSDQTIDEALNNARAITPFSMKEFGPEEMSAMAQACRNCGLEDLFLTSMRIYYPKKTNENKSKKGRPLTSTSRKKKSIGKNGKGEKRGNH